MEFNEKTFEGLTDLELAQLQHEARKLPEDKEFVNAILEELGRRERERKGV